MRSEELHERQLSPELYACQLSRELYLSASLQPESRETDGDAAMVRRGARAAAVRFGREDFFRSCSTFAPRGDRGLAAGASLSHGKPFNIDSPGMGGAALGL